MRRWGWGRGYWLFAGATLAALLTVGLMRPWVTLDTASWLAPCAGLRCLAGPRFPLYRWLFVALTLGGRATGVLPWLQIGAFLGAGWKLAREVRRAGGSSTLAASVAFSFPASNMLLIWGRAEIPEILARAAIVAALAATLRAASGSARAAILAGAMAGIACCLDPAELPFLALLPILAWWLGRRRARTLLLGFAAFGPVLLIAGLRLAVLGDFNIVSFGGYDMAGIAARMVSPEALPRLPAAQRPLAQAIMRRRRRLEADGTVMKVPPNSTGARSLFSEEIGYFDILARFYDPLLSGAVAPLRGQGESWVAFNARLQRFDFAVILARPLLWLGWIAGALARMTGRVLVFNLPFMIATILALALGLWRPKPWLLAGDGRLLFALTAAYTVGSGALACLVAFPAQRYIDGAGLLLPAWPIYAALRLSAPKSGSRPDSIG